MFLQAQVVIRDWSGTGFQTCALPICFCFGKLCRVPVSASQPRQSLPKCKHPKLSTCPVILRRSHVILPCYFRPNACPLVRNRTRHVTNSLPSNCLISSRKHITSKLLFI